MVMEEEQSHMELASESVPVPQLRNLEMEDDTEHNNVKKKKPRFRKKALYAAILKQMEFYFGDANLSKDRFLSNLIEQDPYVDLEVFLRFNKIRALTLDVNQIVRALQKSTMLSISEDGTKVCRVTPVTRKENIDECTVYVQRLPLDADHEWLSTVFSQYGPVAYISIPKYKSNRRIKGFAFVEFEEPISAEKCLQAFRERNCVLPSQTSPDELMSITTFHEEEMMEKELQTCPEIKSRVQDYTPPVKLEEIEIKKEMETDNNEAKINKKRKQSEVETEVDAENEVTSEVEKKHKKSKQKHVADDETETKSNKELAGKILTLDHKDEDNCEVDEEPRSKKQKNKNEDDEKSPEKLAESKKVSEAVEMPEVKKESGDTEEGKKRKRKRHNRGEKLDTADIGMQIMSKKDWKGLRNKYLQLQRNKMKLLKTHLRRTRWNTYEKFREGERCKPSYEEKDTQQNKDAISAPRFVFTPGVIVKVELDEPCTDPKSFKTELKRNSSVKYIDISEGATEAYIRCDTHEAAKTLTSQSNEERSMSILQGNVESEYWEKMSKDRDEKLGKKIRVKQRGRDKLLKKAEKELGKHIKFDQCDGGD